MKTISTKLLFIFFLMFWIQKINAQDPNWSINAANYQYSMTVTSFLNINGTTLISSNDKVAAFVNDEIRGVANVQFVSNANKYVTYLSVFANADNEVIEFKIYNSTTNEVVSTNKTAVFVIDGNLGGILQSYSIASPELNENAAFTSFSFSGITGITSNISSDEINIVLPENTDLTNLVAVFETSLNSKVFVEDNLVISSNNTRDFTNPIIYKVLSENEATLSSYNVIVTKALNSNPTTVVISTSENLNTNTVPVILDIVFSKVVTGFDISDFILENAVLTSFSTSDSQNYEVAVVPLSQGEFSVQIPASISLDENNNENEISNKLDLTYDIAKPVISAISVEENTSSWWFLVTFNEAVLNIDVTDFKLIGMASSNLTVSNISEVSTNQYKIEVANSNTDNGVISLQIKSTNDIADVVGNLLVTSEFEAYFLNNDVLGLEDISNSSSFSIYPNPTVDYFKIEAKNEKLNQISLFDVNGKKVFERKSNRQEEIINIQKLKAGVYFVIIISNSGRQIKKLVKT